MKAQFSGKRQRVVFSPGQRAVFAIESPFPRKGAVPPNFSFENRCKKTSAKTEKPAQKSPRQNELNPKKRTLKQKAPCGRIEISTAGGYLYGKQKRNKTLFGRT